MVSPLSWTFSIFEPCIAKGSAPAVSLNWLRVASTATFGPPWLGLAAQSSALSHALSGAGQTAQLAPQGLSGPPISAREKQPGAGLGKAGDGVAQQPRPRVESLRAAVVPADEPVTRQQGEGIDLRLPPTLNPPRDGGVSPTLAQEDEPVDVRGGVHAPEETGEALDQGGLGIRQIRPGE